MTEISAIWLTFHVNSKTACLTFACHVPCRIVDLLFKSSPYIIGGSIGGVPGAHPLKGPDSFVLTYKMFETYPPRESMPPPYEVHAPPTGNPGSATVYVAWNTSFGVKSSWYSLNDKSIDSRWHTIALYFDLWKIFAGIRRRCSVTFVSRRHALYFRMPTRIILSDKPLLQQSALDDYKPWALVKEYNKNSNISFSTSTSSSKNYVLPFTSAMLFVKMIILPVVS